MTFQNSSFEILYFKDVKGYGVGKEAKMVA